MLFSPPRTPAAATIRPGETPRRDSGPHPPGGSPRTGFRAHYPCGSPRTGFGAHHPCGSPCTGLCARQPRETPCTGFGALRLRGSPRTAPRAHRPRDRHPSRTGRIARTPRPCGPSYASASLSCLGPHEWHASRRIRQFSSLHQFSIFPRITLPSSGIIRGLAHTRSSGAWQRGIVSADVWAPDGQPRPVGAGLSALVRSPLTVGTAPSALETSPPDRQHRIPGARDVGAGPSTPHPRRSRHQHRTVYTAPPALETSAPDRQHRIISAGPSASACQRSIVTGGRYRRGHADFA